MSEWRKIVGATLSWSRNICICFEGGYILPRNIELLCYSEYYTKGHDWPRDPKTGNKLDIYEP